MGEKPRGQRLRRRSHDDDQVPSVPPRPATGPRRGTSARRASCARWLAAFDQLLYHGDNSDLAESHRTKDGLLLEALRVDPHDERARRLYAAYLREGPPYSGFEAYLKRHE